MKKMKIHVVLMLHLICLMFSRASGMERSSTTVKLHEAATLQCYKSCSGLVTWSAFTKQHDILASCDQTSCQSQEGFQMLHDEYLKGNLSLIITDADFNKRKLYTCQCDDKDICDVSLKLEPLSRSLPVKVGDSVYLDSHVSEDVEVIFKKSDDDPKTLKLCKVEGRKVQFEPSFENRVSVSLKLKDVKNSDEGVYIIQDISNDEVIGTYSVTINERRSETDDCKKGASSCQHIHTGLAVMCGVVMGFISCLMMLKLTTKQTAGTSGHDPARTEEMRNLSSDLGCTHTGSG